MLVVGQLVQHLLHSLVRKLIHPILHDGTNSSFNIQRSDV